MEKNLTQTDLSAAERVFRPAFRSMWFLFFGLLLGPAIMYFERDPEGHPLKWLGLSLVFLGLIIHRLSLKYTLGGGLLKASSWWGLRPDERLTLAFVSEARVMQGFTGRLVGCGHIEVRSLAPDETALVILDQPDPWKTAEAIEVAAARERQS